MATPGKIHVKNENIQSAFVEPKPEPLLEPEQEQELEQELERESEIQRKKSTVWEHFTIETVGDGCRRACCKQCNRSFAYSTGSKVAGTSHLKRHIVKGSCKALLRGKDKNQFTPYSAPSKKGGTDAPKRRYRSPSAAYISFDPDRCRHEIAKMIIMHDYPLHMVEHPGFVSFVQNLQPQFDMLSFNTVQGDCVEMYLSEKQRLTKFIEGIHGRICLTLEMWTSSQSVSYVFVTGHFIDTDWIMHRRILNVVMEPYPDSDTVLSHAVAVCLSDWNLEGRLFSVAYNQPLSDSGLENLQALLCMKDQHILNGQLTIGNCIAWTLCYMAKEAYGAGHHIIKKIRDSVKYVKTSDFLEDKFLGLKQQLQVPSEKILSLDNRNQWNTTYQMLVAASELKEVFVCLDTSDPDYKDAPTMEDWKLVETLCVYLKPIVDAATFLTTTNYYPTANTLFHELWKVHSELARGVVSKDPFINSLAKSMQDKLDKYWKDCSLAMAISIAMDPRFKLKLVEFSFSRIFGEDAPTYAKMVYEGIHELFHEYEAALPLPLTPTYADEGNMGSNGKSEDDGLTDFDVYIMETTGQLMKSELDQYLDESLLPRIHDFDVLAWWKQNEAKYPTLSKMARDILSIPVTTACPQSVFDTTGKEMDQYRSSLRPETVEALVCAKNWLQQGSVETPIATVKMEV